MENIGGGRGGGEWHVSDTFEYSRAVDPHSFLADPETVSFLIADPRDPAKKPLKNHLMKKCFR